MWGSGRPWMAAVIPGGVQIVVPYECVPTPHWAESSAVKCPWKDLRRWSYDSVWWRDIYFHWEIFPAARWRLFSEYSVTIGFLNFCTIDILDGVMLWCGAVLCVVGNLAASLGSTHSSSTLPQLWAWKMSLPNDPGGQNCFWLKTPTFEIRPLMFVFLPPNYSQ